MTQSAPSGLRTPSRRLQPGMGEGIVMGKALELVPVVVDGVDMGLVGPGEARLELKIVGRIGKDQIDRACRQGVHVVNAVADQNGIDRQPGFVRLRILGSVEDTRGTQHTLNPNAALTTRLYLLRVKCELSHRVNE